jgi:hypothetical protein
MENLPSLEKMLRNFGIKGVADEVDFGFGVKGEELRWDGLLLIYWSQKMFDTWFYGFEIVGDGFVLDYRIQRKKHEEGGQHVTMSSEEMNSIKPKIKLPWFGGRKAAEANLLAYILKYSE